jgi:3-keto-5-aminohexanoate cleavage enzyme
MNVDELMICVAPYPGEKQEEKFLGRMDLPDEVFRCYNAGASIVHLHVRDEKGNQTMDPTVFRKDVEKIHSQCPMIIEGSTGGLPEHTLQERCVSFTIAGIEMGSLNLGSVNLFGGVYQNPMSDIRFYAQELKKRDIKPFLCVFDLSMFHNGERLEKEGLISPPYAYNFVFDMPDSIPFSKRTLDVFLDFLPKESHWFMTRHHSKGWEGFQLALERGGHVRVGYEDGPFLSSGKRAKSNAELVEEIVEAAQPLGRKVIEPNQTRALLDLKAFHPSL